MEAVGKSILKEIFPRKPEWTHKGDYGRLLVISGSRWMTGSPATIGLAAMRTGADILSFVGPERAMNVTANSSHTFITEPLAGNFLGMQHVKQVLDFLDIMKPTAVAIGPGLWRNQETRKAVVEIIGQLSVPMVIDADAVRALSGNAGVLDDKQAIITPHADEFRELTGVHVTQTTAQRADVVRRKAEELKTVILLKGHVDIISDGKRTRINKSGNAHMTKGGMGDSLTGICAALVARRINKIDIFTAACAAAYINRRAGDIAARRFKEGVSAADLIDNIPLAIQGK